MPNSNGGKRPFQQGKAKGGAAKRDGTNKHAKRQRQKEGKPRPPAGGPVSATPPQTTTVPSEDDLYVAGIPWHIGEKTLWDEITPIAVKVGNAALAIGLKGRASSLSKKKKKSTEGEEDAELDLIITQLESAARSIHGDYVATPISRGHKASSMLDEKWLSTVMKSGTVSDQVASCILALRMRPLRALRALDALISLSKRKLGAAKAKEAAAAAAGGGKAKIGASAQAITALVDLFSTSVLPERRKLRSFRDWNWDVTIATGLLVIVGKAEPNHVVERSLCGKSRDLAQRALCYRLWESELKERYGQFVSHLSRLSIGSSLEYQRDQVTKAMYELLNARPEREATLLQAIVNKLGDASRKLASRTIYLLQCLIEEHSAMKTVVAQEVRRFVLRTRLPPRPMYYAIVFLNQLPLQRTSSDYTLANTLVELYARVFTALLKEDSKVHEEGQKLKGKKKRKKFKKVSKKPKSSSTSGTTFRAPTGGVDSRLVSALLTGISRAMPYAQLADSSEAEGDWRNHVDDLYTIARKTALSRGVQALQVLLQMHLGDRKPQQNAKEPSPLPDRFYRILYEMLLEPDLSKANRRAVMLNVLHRALSLDVSNPVRQCAFVKRIIGVCSLHDPSFISALLIVASETIRKNTSLWLLLGKEPISGTKTSSLGDSSEDEDQNDDAEDDKRARKGENREESEAEEKNALENTEISSLLNVVSRPSTKKTVAEEGTTCRAHARARRIKEAEIKQKEQVDELKKLRAEGDAYDPTKRDPRFAHAHMSALWDLVPLTNHMHPTVALFARTLLSKECIDYGGDPLQDFTLFNYLERFSTKNPRQRERLKGNKVMRPPERAAAGLGLNIGAELNEGDVPEDSLFFYRYLDNKRKNLSHSGASRSAKRVEDLDEPSDDEVDAALRAELGVLEDGEDDDIFMGSSEMAEGDGWGSDASETALTGDVGGSDEEDAFGDGEGVEWSDDQAVDWGSDGDEDSDGDGTDAMFGNDSDENDGEVATFSEDDDDGEGGEKAVFAAAEEYAQMLESGGGGREVNPRQLEWEERHSGGRRGGRGRRGKRGGGSGSGSGSGGQRGSGGRGRRGGAGGGAGRGRGMKRDRADRRGGRRGNNKRRRQ